MQHPIYQFRMILPYDEAVVNVATDMDFNVDGEVKYPVSNYLMAKTNFKVYKFHLLISVTSLALPFVLQIGEQETSLSGDLELTDDSSASQLQYSSAENALTLSYMQSVHPFLTLGGAAASSDLQYVHVHTSLRIFWDACVLFLLCRSRAVFFEGQDPGHCLWWHRHLRRKHIGLSMGQQCECNSDSFTVQVCCSVCPFVCTRYLPVGLRAQRADDVCGQIVCQIGAPLIV